MVRGSAKPQSSGMIGGRRIDKWGSGRIDSNKLIKATSDRPLLAIIIDVDSGDKFQSWGEGRYLLEEATGTPSDVSPITRWLVYRLGGGEVLVRC